MGGSFLEALAPRMRRASFVLIPAGIVFGAGALLALNYSYVSIEDAAALLALSFVLTICGVVLFVASWFGRNRR